MRQSRYRSSLTTTSSRNLYIQSTKLVRINRCWQAIDWHCSMGYSLQNLGMTTDITSVGYQWTVFVSWRTFINWIMTRRNQRPNLVFITYNTMYKAALPETIWERRMPFLRKACWAVFRRRAIWRRGRMIEIWGGSRRAGWRRPRIPGRPSYWEVGGIFEPNWRCIMNINRKRLDKMPNKVVAPVNECKRR